MKIHHFLLGLILLPFYSLLKRMKVKTEKIQMGEKVVVIIEKQGKKKRIQ